MKTLLLFLISWPAYSNSFKLPDTGARFSLRITAKELVYESEAMTKSFRLKNCNLTLARELNSEILKRLPASKGSDGFMFIVDDYELYLDKKSELTSLVLMMDPRIQRFSVEEKEACR